MINVNDFNFGNGNETETEGNDIIVSGSNNEWYSLPVLSDCKTQAQLVCLFHPADTAQNISILTSCSHGITNCCISFIVVFFATNLVSFSMVVLSHSVCIITCWHASLLHQRGEHKGFDSEKAGLMKSHANALPLLSNSNQGTNTQW